MNYFVINPTDKESTLIVRNDGAFIPADEGNSDYRAYLAWLDDGNTPEPYESSKD